MLKKLCQSIGLAAMILVMNFGDLLGGGSDVRMHLPYAAGPVVMAQIADILLVGLAISLVFALSRRANFYRWVQLAIAIAVPAYLMVRMENLWPFVVRHGVVPVLAVVWVLVVLVVFVKLPLLYGRLLRAGDAAGIFFAAFAFFAIAQLFWVMRWKPGPQEQAAVWATSAQVPREHPLLVWVVFDELSYDQVFENRARGLELPNFDRLRAVSTVFTDVQPIGDKTVKILPSLLSGKVVDEFRYEFDNRLLVRDAGQKGMHVLNGRQSVFGDAQRSGWRTAAVGWYNPYCGTYGDSIDDCYWINLDTMDGMMSQRAGFLRNTVSPLKQMVEEIAAPARAKQEACSFEVQQREATYAELEQKTMRVLRTDQADFVFLHLPVPHSPNIWNRSAGAFATRCGRSYVDNLALTDRMLGEMMQTMQASPRWKETTLIVQGDHSWRVRQWNWLPAWTAEDEAVSRGVFDTRPAMMVHEAGQAEAKTNGTAWPVVRVHEVVEAALRGERPQL